MKPLAVYVAGPLIKLMAIGIVAPTCVVVGKLLLGSVAVVAAFAYLAICMGRALQSTRLN